MAAGRSGDDLLIEYTPSLAAFFLSGVLAPAVVTWLALWLLIDFLIRSWKSNSKRDQNLDEEWWQSGQGMTR